MTTITYDQPVKDLIAGLSATGHVNHTSYKKTMVTLHHNAGVLSHEQVLATWQTREASAHFDVDRAGAVAQYVKVDEYAWACGNTWGNETSISIEMSNSATGGNWPVSETTWRAAARLAGWLFAHVIGTRPNASNLVPHHHWYSTSCAGPYMDSVFPSAIAAAQAAYDSFTNPPPPPVPPVDEEDGMAFKSLKLVKQKNSDAIWVGNGLFRRWVQDPDELMGIQYWIRAEGGDDKVEMDFDDMRVLGVDIATLQK
jgi:hypothetical protein